MIDIPKMIESSIKMPEPNYKINAYSGDFIIKYETEEVKLTGDLYYGWFPNPGLRFIGQSLNERPALYKLINEQRYLKLIIHNLDVGDVIVTRLKGGIVEGVFSHNAVLGDKSIAVTKLIFCVPNLRSFFGEPVIKEDIIYRNRLEIHTPDCSVILDKHMDDRGVLSRLRSEGGYAILYNGELINKKGSIQLTETNDVLHCLSNFLWFLNGRRTSPLFVQGVYDNEIIWTDYTSRFVDIFKDVTSWVPAHSIEGVNGLWIEFHKTWKSNKDFLTSMLHWYVEANGNSAFSEGSIIMAQTALELLYNWWLIENKKLIIGKDSENISAANKIRLLLSHLNIDYTVPPAFTSLQEYIDENKEIIDAPDAIVQIRNAIVHSQEEKRRKLSSISPMGKHQALQLYLWYIEMGMLRILDYKGMYYNRCSESNFAGEGEEYVPWVTK